MLTHPPQSGGKRTKSRARPRHVGRARGQVDLATIDDASLDQVETDRPGRARDLESAGDRQVADPVRLQPCSILRARHILSQVGVIGEKVCVVRLKVRDESRLRRAGRVFVRLDFLPLDGVGNEMPVTQFRPGVGGRMRRIVARSCGRLVPVAGLEGRPALPFRSIGEGFRPQAIVIDHHLHGSLMLQRPAFETELVASRRLDKDVAVPDPERFAGQADEAFDVADLRFFRISEDDDVPTPRPQSAGEEGHVVGKLHDEDAVALEARLVGQLHLIPAIDANPRTDAPGR